MEVAADRNKTLKVVVCLQCDQTMKAVTVSYFSLQHALTSPVPTQFQTLCESSRLYEPGSQFMEYVKRMPEPMAGAQDRSVMSDPFHFEPYTLDAAARSASESAASSGIYIDCVQLTKLHKAAFGYFENHAFDSSSQVC